MTAPTHLARREGGGALDAMSDLRFICYLEDYDVARLILARPPLNIMTLEMLREISAVPELAATRPSLKVVVLSGEGKAFSGGLAIEEHMGNRVTPMLEAFHDISRRLRALPCLTVAVVRVPRWAAPPSWPPSATWSSPPRTPPSGSQTSRSASSRRSPRCTPRAASASQALALLLAGEVVAAAEAERLGLVDKVGICGQQGRTHGP
jgi:cyclohexa-1,5-dienecarbonyl-CoA hydratase